MNLEIKKTKEILDNLRPQSLNTEEECKQDNAISRAIAALNAEFAYREIGTIEECRTAVAKLKNSKEK